MLEVEKFISEHKDNWIELLQEKPYALKCNENDDYVLLKYNMILSDFTLPLVKECRGIVIDKHSLRAVALSFVKFFNVQEPLHDEIDWSTAKIQEKVDGTKILCWYDRKNEKWIISTSGSLDAFKSSVHENKADGETYGDLFVEALGNINLNLDGLFKSLNSKYCYTFELVSPKSRIVVPYRQTKIFLIGLRDVETFEELSPDIEENVINLGIPRPKEYPLHSLEDCMNATAKMGFDEEGFVVVDALWKRVKIKSPEYVLAHYLRFNGGVSYSRILELIETKNDEKMLKIYPEYKPYFDEVYQKLNSLKSNVISAMTDVQEKMETEGSDRKTLALYILSKYKDISVFLFRLLDTKQFESLGEVFDKVWDNFTKNKKLAYLGFDEESDADEFKEE